MGYFNFFGTRFYSPVTIIMFGQYIIKNLFQKNQV